MQIARDWQTPSVADVTGGHMTRGGARRGEKLLNGQVAEWATPQEHNGSKGAASRGPNGTSRGADLVRQVREVDWATPKAVDGRAKGNGGARKSPCLSEQMREWPRPRATQTPETPETVDARLARAKARYAEDPSRRWGVKENLHSAVARQDSPTPTTNDAKNGAPPSQHHRHTPPLNVQAVGPHDPVNRSTTGSRPALSPDWVEVLMGYPPGWTA